tara:strand:- start:527 stop:1132 length:606 start_codon:yes stop_codon:yes gene_type:complete
MSYLGKQPRKNRGGVIALKSQTADGTASLTFNNMDATYVAYEFHFINIHPVTDQAYLTFQVNAEGNTAFAENMTTTFFRTKNHENGSDQEIAYVASYDQADGDDAEQALCNETGNGNDESINGVFTLYDPANTTVVRHFASRVIEYHASDIVMDSFCAGYITPADITDPIDEIRFKFHSGNIDSGTIKMYGIKALDTTEVS